MGRQGRAGGHFRINLLGEIFHLEHLSLFLRENSQFRKEFAFYSKLTEFDISSYLRRKACFHSGAFKKDSLYFKQKLS